jgi:uncharacterized membrane protein YbhN (UPF0104 family)
VNVRFLQRHGLPAGTALTVGALDSVAQFVVQVALLVVLLVFTPLSLDLDLSSGAAGTGVRLLAVAVVIAVIAIGLVLAVRRWRTLVIGWTRNLFVEAVDAVRGLRSPRRLVALLGGNLATEILLAVALGVFARAFGYAVGLDELLLISISVSLLSGLLPVPGGIGVVEAGLTLGLTRVGVPDEVAFAVALLYRLATFYLPPIWGYFAMGWLQRKDHL